MNTFTNAPSALSLNSIDLLAYNGYKSTFSERLVQFKRNYDFIGPFILFLLFAMISLPLFDYSYWVGTAIFMALVLGVYFHHQLLSKKATINIDEASKQIEVKNRRGQQKISFGEVDAIFIKSRFNGTFSSADKLTNEEYDISVGVTLRSGNNISLFNYKSDFREPNEEIMEVHNYLRSTLVN